MKMVCCNGRPQRNNALHIANRKLALNLIDFDTNRMPNSSNRLSIAYRTLLCVNRHEWLRFVAEWRWLTNPHNRFEIQSEFKFEVDSPICAGCISLSLMECTRWHWGGRRSEIDIMSFDWRLDFLKSGQRDVRLRHRPVAAPFNTAEGLWRAQARVWKKRTRERIIGRAAKETLNEPQKRPWRSTNCSRTWTQSPSTFRSAGIRI